ncbi:MAG: NAD(P)H-hydrate dehydratase [Gammaproteobacteria bacterium]|nr:NAD(P)H-hydrate dehydratase [Gammaproteobacteria bacterium]
MAPPRETLPTAVYSAAQVRELDRIAIEQRGIAGYELMCRAGQAALDVLKAHWPDAHKLTVFCGAGNNAGDGYVLARLARAAGLSVRVEAVVPPTRLGGDARTAWEECRDAGVAIHAFEPQREDSAAGFVPDVVVDALLGTGLARPVEGRFAEAVEHVNGAGAPVLALDVPSGLHADTGRVLGTAVRADVTVTFVGLKQGLFLGDAPDRRGVLEFSDLMLPPDVSAAFEPALERLNPALLRAALPRRPRSAHKGDAGRVLLIGGGPGMSGAIRLAAEAALRVGAGLVYVATHRDSVQTVMSGRPELMCRAADSPADLDPLLAAADCIVLGPGLGRTDWARALWQRVVRHERPLVVDADGLNLLAGEPFSRRGWLLTPHPAEAARLLGTDTEAVQGDRLGAVRSIAERYAATVVLKGAGTLIAAPPGAPSVAVCDYGNPGMATAGMGDVLSGVLGGLLGQLRDVPLTARAGTLLHALAGDDAAADGERGTVAGDLMPALRRWANPS